MQAWSFYFGGQNDNRRSLWEYDPKTPKMGVNTQFQAKTPKYKNRNIRETTNPI